MTGSTTFLHLRFFDAAAEAQAEGEPEREATIHYSAGNFLANLGEYAAAISRFNQARRRFPDYLSRQYFLNELGGCLFLSRHFRCSALAYGSAVSIEADGKALICLGDALLYSGQFALAVDAFARVIADDRRDIACEGSLKLWLVQWLLDQVRDDNAFPALSEINSWVQIAQGSMNSNSHEQALAAHLVLAFQLENEPAIWCGSILAGIRLADIQLLSYVILCSQTRCGFQPYEVARIQIAEVIEDQSALDQLDALSLQLYSESQPEKWTQTTIRSLRDPNFDVALFRVDPSPGESRFLPLDGPRRRD